MSTYAVGIDLGTTHSCVAVYQYGKVEVIANDHGSRTTPSYVSFTDAGRLVGNSAKNQALLFPKNTIYDSKRLIGRRYDDETVQADIQNWPFTVTYYKGFPKIQVVYKKETISHTPEEISSMILSKMIETAESYLEQKINKAVITVPAYFNNFQKQATINAGAMAGLDVLYILSEPVAAAITYAVEKENMKAKVMIFDLGGGTLDVSIVTICDTRFVVNSISGNTHLGGEDFTNNLVNYFIKIFKDKHNKDLRSNARSFSQLKQECDLAKNMLSFQEEVKIVIISIMDGLDLIENITRAKFNDLNAKEFASTLETVKKALGYANMTRDDIDRVIMVGGSSRIPKINSLLKEYFGNEKKVFKSVNVDEAIAYGAGVYAAKLNNINLKDRNTFVVHDVTPQSLSVGVHNNDDVSVIIPKNSLVPISETKEYVTTRDGQTMLYFPIYEGENQNRRGNTFLGNCILNGIPPGPRGRECVKVTFSVDTNRVLKVTAIHRTTGKYVETIIDRRLKQ